MPLSLCRQLSGRWECLACAAKAFAQQSQGSKGSAPTPSAAGCLVFFVVGLGISSLLAWLA
jgi:hypothetical protein